MAETKILNLAGLQHYDEKIKAHLAAADEAMLAAAKAHAEGLADNYDAAGTAATKVQELADGAVKANADAIAKLNGTATTEGSVAKAVADAKALVDADVDAVEAKADKNAEDIGVLQGEMDAVEKKADDNANEISGLKGRMDAAEGEIDALQEDVGNVDDLSTANKDVVGAINEVLAAVGTGGTAAVVTMTAKGATEEYANVYELKQGETLIGNINIPKDMVVESGEVVDVEGVKNIKLVLQNVAEPLYIPVGSLVDIYVAKAEAAQVQIAIDSTTREISASIVAGSVTATELAANAVVTEKIADKNVTKAKLSAEVQASLDKADVSAAKADLDAEIDRAKAAEAQALTDAKAHTDAQVAAEKARAEGIESGLDNRLKTVEEAIGETGSIAEDIAAAKQEAIEAAAADATSKANTAEANAKAHADDLADANKALIDANAGEITALKGRMDTAEGDIDNLQASLAEGGATANAIAAAKKAGDDAQADVDALELRVGTNETNIGSQGDRIAALEGKVGDGFAEITTAEIDAMFAAE